jgi:glutathione S-transferase
MMKFYFTPGACSTGIHILLEELGLVFEAYLINLLAGDQYQAGYQAINPKGTIPTLVLEDGTALTEFAAIAYWLAQRHPKAQLLPTTPEAAAHVLEVLSYVVGTVHGQGFTRIFTTEQFTPNVADQAAVKAQGLAIVQQGFQVIAGSFRGDPFISTQFSIADAALFYVEFWADKQQITLPEPCQRHYAALLKRPAVRQVLQEEGCRV